MSDGFAALFWGVISFSLLVVIHEGGHFLAARLFGVHVHEFMIGLPGPAIRFRGPKTTYGITAVPLGGYVRIAGMEPGPEEPLLAPALATVTRLRTASAFDVASALGIDEGPADRLLITLADWNAIVPVEGDEYTYRSRFEPEDASDPALIDRARASTYRGLSWGKRIAVLCMGVVFNLITAILVFTVVLSTFGVGEDSGLVGAVSPGSAAERAGIVAGDRIVSVDGVATPDFMRLMTSVARHEPGARVEVRYEHDGQVIARDLTLGKNPETKRALLGISPDVEIVRLNPLEAFLKSFTYIWLTFAAIAGFFDPTTFQASVALSSSVIGASVAAADAAKAGPLDFAGLIAALSLSLGVLNILPIPPLDGGKIALELVEKLRGRPLSRALSLGLSASGAMLLFALIGYLMYADVAKMVGS